MTSLPGDPVETARLAPTDEQDRLYLDLKGARERLCRAQVHAPPPCPDGEKSDDA